tara:strand:- start:178 stop:522 length:345 start_codon:yes stop_codon:yes gene_type:complete
MIKKIQNPVETNVHCPSCNELVVGDNGVLVDKPCSHLIMGYNSAMDGDIENFYFLSDSIRKEVELQVDQEVNDTEIADGVAERMNDDHHVILMSDPDYLGGCIYSVDILIFKNP